MSRRLRLAAAMARDQLRPTYAVGLEDIRPARCLLPASFDAAAVDDSACGWLFPVAELHAGQWFDVLGSGWVQPLHGLECRGLEGIRFAPHPEVVADGAGDWLEGRVAPGNLPESRRVWQALGGEYQPIDWQLDVKSGYRWSSRQWYRMVRRRPPPAGADIKVPWEIGRLNHLPILARAFAASRAEGAEDPRAAGYVEAFRRHVLDFIATNPPRFGVQWSSTMDVGIRAVNLVVGRDLFLRAGWSFDEPFEEILTRSLLEHGVHILDNLEWSPRRRGNHYLANVVGLLFIAASLPSSRRADAWLAFGAQELLAEIDRQFLVDGGNFEASTYYHCLSAEMVFLGLALLLGLEEDRREALGAYNHELVTAGPGLRPGPLDLGRALEEAAPRLGQIVQFSRDVTKPGGRIHQVGDTDSGAVLRLDPSYRRLSVEEARASFANLEGYRGLPDDADYWYLDHLDRSAGITAQSRLPSPPGPAASGPATYGTVFLEALAAGRRLPEPREECRSAAPSADAGGIAAVEASIRAEPRFQYVLELPADLDRSRLRWCVYPAFGLYIVRSEELYLAIRCGSFGGESSGGHAHNDQLAVELSVRGQDVVVDPGSYLYTPLPQRRNEYRSAAAHFVPRVDGREPADLGRGTFRLVDELDATCDYFGPEGFVGHHSGYGAPVHRVVRILEDRIIVTDHAPSSLRLVPALRGGSALMESPGYGILRRDVPGGNDDPGVREASG